MSLAVSVIIAPSRRLRCLLAAFCASLCAAGLAVGLLLPERFAFGGAVACVPLLAALSLLRPLLHAIATVRRIDISGVGQLGLTVQHEWRKGRAAAAFAASGSPMTLLPGATVWPCCILLRLRAEDGATWPLVLLPDAVPPSQYRALAVAVRALANGAATIPIQNSVNLLQGANS
ncbi:protein YgfX [Massilia sp. HP4]|uniref:protein YgfX n=1 Tax=Massilia sp. HP4 TaxID=2562316 RepID=UPI0010BF8065|nr:protein YgfX [Massilia sp. HP4]